MRAGHTESLVLTGQSSQHLGTLLYLKAVFAEIL